VNNSSSRNKIPKELRLQGHVGGLPFCFSHTCPYGTIEHAYSKLNQVRSTTSRTTLRRPCGCDSGSGNALRDLWQGRPGRLDGIAAALSLTRISSRRLRGQARGGTTPPGPVRRSPPAHRRRPRRAKGDQFRRLRHSRDPRHRQGRPCSLPSGRPDHAGGLRWQDPAPSEVAPRFRIKSLEPRTHHVADHFFFGAAATCFPGRSLTTTS
jgi:hypothetical protein